MKLSFLYDTFNSKLGNFLKKVKENAALSSHSAGEIPYLTGLNCDAEFQGVFYKDLTEHRSYELTKEESKDVWWTLILRGICWVRCMNVSHTSHTVIRFDFQSMTWMN
jgi:hypothetical protein